MSENQYPTQYELKENILNPVEGNNIQPPVNTFESQQKFVIKSSCQCEVIGVIMTGVVILLYLHSFLYNWDNIIANIIIFAIVIIIQILFDIKALKSNIKKTELIKDVQNNRFEINSINYFNEPISSEILSLNSINFNEVSYTTKSKKGSHHTFYGLIIINTFENKSLLDLDQSDIRNKPRKIFYLLDNISRGNIKEQLCNFVNCSPEPDNPIFLNIDKYMGKSWDNKYPYTFGSYKISKYMKISDTFYSFYLGEKDSMNDRLLAYNYLMGIFAIFGIMVVFHTISELYIKIISLTGCILFIILINCLIIFIYKSKRNKLISRIDIIYSINFDRIFIGLVNHNEKAYLNTFLFHINSIDKFTLQSIIKSTEKSKNKNNLQVVLKNGETQTICQINDFEATLEGLLFILNEKLINRNEPIINNNNNLLVKNWE